MPGYTRLLRNRPGILPRVTDTMSASRRSTLSLLSLSTSCLGVLLTQYFVTNFSRSPTSPPAVYPTLQHCLMRGGKVRNRP